MLSLINPETLLVTKKVLLKHMLRGILMTFIQSHLNVLFFL